MPNFSSMILTSASSVRIVRARGVAVLAATAVLMASCGRLDSSSATSGSAATEGHAISTPTLDEVDLTPFFGAPPVWNLDLSLTSTLFRHFLGATRPDPGETDEELVARYELPLGCIARGDAPELGFDDCLGKVLLGEGASPESVVLLRDFGLVVRALEGPGPVWVAWLYDISYYESNGYNANYIFTPSGVLTKEILWSLPAYSDAVDDAKTSQAYEQIAEALTPFLAGSLPSYGQFGGEDNFFGAPQQTADGWTVPLTMGLTGCHACESEFAGRFALDFTSEGNLAAVRYVDHCFYSDEVHDWTSDPAIQAAKGSLPSCEPHTAHDGSVRALS